MPIIDKEGFRLDRYQEEKIRLRWIFRSKDLELHEQVQADDMAM